MRLALIAICAGTLFCSVVAADESIACGQSIRGTLAAGTPFGTLRLSGAAGQYVQAIVYPSDSPRLDIALVPQAGDAPPPPLVTGGKGGAVAFVLPSSGPRTLELTGSGDYLVALTCHAAPYADLPECVDQTILCDQTADWVLTTKSCAFDDNPSRRYAAYMFSGNAGDIVSADLESADFPPRLGIYRARAGGPFAASDSISATRDQLIVALPDTGLYLIAVTSRRDSTVRTGRFKLTVHDCASPGCLPPLFIEEPADVVVPYGTSATLTATAIGGGSMRYIWSDRSNLPAPIAEGRQFKTPRVTGTQSYGVTVVTPCGTAESRVVTVSPLKGHRRPARH